MFLQRQVDGLILLAGYSSENYLIELAKEIPMIIVGRELPELKQQCLPFDDFEAALKATRYLIDSGHQQIAHITGLSNHFDAIERKEGYLAALKQAGIESNPNLIIEGDFTEPSGVMAVEMLLMRGNIFSGIFAANDQMAYGARLALYRRGLRVPEDVSIVGFDDQAPTAYMVPPLTTIRRPPLEIGEAAGKALINLIQGKSVTIPKFQSTLMIRESVIRRL
jgi:LacI family transcriptional regulator